MKKIISGFIITMVVFCNFNLSVFASDDESLYEIKNYKTEVGEEIVAVSFQVETKNKPTNFYVEVWPEDLGNKYAVRIDNVYHNGTIAYSIDAKNFDNNYGRYKSRLCVLGESKCTELQDVEISEIESQEVNTYSSDAVEISKEQETFTDLEMLDASVDKQAHSLFKDVTIQEENGKFLVKATFNDISQISSVISPVWSTQGWQDDLIWGFGTLTGNTYTYTVDMQDHYSNTGEYQIHVYAYDKNGNVEIKALTANMNYENPKIEDIKVDKGEGKYTITLNLDSYGISSVQFPTWSDKGGQDDLIWGQGTINGNTVTYTVDMKDHKFDKGVYYTNIYAYDKKGNVAVASLSEIITATTPSISDITTKKESGKYTVTAKIQGYNIAQVMFPTWSTKNGQDDLIWGQGVINGDKVSFTVDIKDHKFETGNYITHIYLYDGMGNVTVASVNENISTNAPTISNLQVNTSDGKCTITADLSDDVGLSAVMMPTWSVKNGQDDLIWGQGSIKGNKLEYTVDIKDHKYDLGEYITNIYVYDLEGNITTTSLSNYIKVNAPKIKNVHVTSSAGLYTITADVEGYDIGTVLYPTWTERNGQDDLLWGSGTINNGKISFTMDMKDHGYETGKYITHIYAYDKLGQLTTYAIDQSVFNNPPVISNVEVSDVSSQGYLVTATITDDYALSQVQLPTWSLSNGQDDMYWGTGSIVGNKLSYRVYVKDHNYDFGQYQTHIYAYDKAGLLTAVEAPVVSVNASSNTNGWEVVNGHKYLYDANGQLVNGSGYFVIDVSENNGSIDWEAVRTSGVDGVILRSSYGFAFNDDWSANYAQMDSQFKRNVSELNRLGIPYGIYHFTYARNIGEGSLEARYLLNCLKEAGARPTLPIYYDLESSKYVGEKSGDFYRTITSEFASVISSAGYPVGVYANYNWWTNKLTDSSFNNYIKWVAHYGTDANNEAGTANPSWHPDSRFKMWQYSSRGSIRGISGNVDMNALLKW